MSDIIDKQATQDREEKQIFFPFEQYTLILKHEHVDVNGDIYLASHPLVVTHLSSIEHRGENILLMLNHMLKKMKSELLGYEGW